MVEVTLFPGEFWVFPFESNNLSYFEAVALQVKKKLDAHPSGLDFG